MSDDLAPADIRVERDLCIGSGVCIVLAAATFEHDAESKAFVRADATDGPDALRAAVDGCPTGAVQLIPHDE
ncbi:MAG: ferredoxin [Nocardia sp.]|nr:ferredoxin [Nocardia sp.]